MAATLKSISTSFSAQLTRLINRITSIFAPAQSSAPVVTIPTRAPLALPAPMPPVALLPAFTATREAAAIAQAAEAKRRAWKQFCALLELGKELQSESILITPVRVPYPGMGRSVRRGDEIHTATQQQQIAMMEQVPNARTPREAHSVLMDQWLAEQAAKQAGKSRPDDLRVGMQVSAAAVAERAVKS